MTRMRSGQIAIGALLSSIELKLKFNGINISAVVLSCNQVISVNLTISLVRM